MREGGGNEGGRTNHAPFGLKRVLHQPAPAEEEEQGEDGHHLGADAEGEEAALRGAK
jgi:hypothetical protein